ncbi:hypothetical protein I5M27_17650 [Adhaeribacter sp. BT258]|uniref:HEAT repeat domain-containing protein n=1 Tax=Adhaeribacter terrigena TaxID=2793070 RepID=A0ABS1C623_9BACT|nr:hypothetical protein [Adhaeribacter terrigena]MBK0404821.1 hypothetical protein [Adhaeribacter terrigena]
MEEKVKEAIELLQNPKSSKRESGAKKLRKLESLEAGPALVQALQKEIKDSRTWSTQYHLILAIGHSKYEAALPILLELAKKNFEATILYLGLGDSIFRLSILSNSIQDSLQQIYDFNNYMLIDGAFRALALLQIVPDDAIIKEIFEKAIDPKAVDFIQSYPNDPRGLRLWAAAASSGWKNELKSSFLKDCDLIPDNALKFAVENSRKGKYVKWNPY